MDIVPIAGIRSVSLFDSRRIGKDLPPHFEVEATAEAGDEANQEERRTPDESSEERCERSDDPEMEAVPELKIDERTINLMA